MYIKHFLSKKVLAKLLIIVSLFSLAFNFSYAASGTPAILGFQGRLYDSSGNLLGGSGTIYYFKFSLWDNVSTTTGNKLWPALSPNSASTTVRQGVFNVNIGDTANGYPDALNYNFNTNNTVYLQIEVSSDNIYFETLSPRELITASAFSQLSSAVSGTGQSSFGTTTPIANSVVSILSTSTNSTALTIGGFVGQVANLFQIQNSSGANLFSVASSGLLSGINASFTGAISASNISGTSTGTNSGDVAIGTGNGLYLAGQTLSLGLASSTGTGALSSADWNIFNEKLSTTSAAADYVSTTTLTSTYPSFSYASSTYASTSFVVNNFPTFAYASSTFASTSWVNDTFQKALTNPVTGTGLVNQLAIFSGTSEITGLATGTAGTFLRSSSTSPTGFDWALASSSGGSGVWGFITGTLSSQGDLQTALNEKLSTTSAAADYVSTTTLTSTYPSFSYASSTYASTSFVVNNFPTFDYASSTFASTSWVYSTFASTSWVTANYPNYAYASSTFASTSFVTNNFPTFAYASSTFASTSWVLGTFASTSWINSTFPSFAYASSTFASTSWITSTFPTFAYASSTFASTSFVVNNFPNFSYASSTYASTSWVIGTFASTSWVTNTFATILSLGTDYISTSTFTSILSSDYVSTTTLTSNYPTFSYASSTFASTSFVVNNFPTFSYASSTFASTSFVTATYVPYTGANANVNLGANSFTVSGTSTLATTSITSLSLDNGLSNSFLAVDANGNIISTTTPTSGASLSGGATNTLAYWTSSTTIASLETGTPGTFLKASSTSSTGFEWAFASSGSATVAWGAITGPLSDQGDLETALNALLSTTTASSTYLKIANATSTYVSFSYASSTFASTSFVVNNFPTFAYASSTFASTSWIVGTFASTSWVLSTFASTSWVLGTFASTSFVTTNFPTFAYASSTFASTSFVTATYVPYTGATGAVNLGTQSFTANGTNIMASTTISQVTLGNNLTSSFLAVDQNGNITSTTTSEFVTGTPWTGMSYLTGVVTSGGTLSGIGTVGSPLAWSNTNNYISNISGQDLSTADNSTSQFLSSATASSTYASTTWVLGTFASTSWVTNTFETITALGADYVSTTTLTSTYPSFAYASSTFASTSWVLGTFASTSYLTSNYPTFAYASSTYASTSYLTGNYPTFSYASSTFASTSFVTTNFPTFEYASSSYQPMTTLGDIIYGGDSGAATVLSGNTTTVQKFLAQTGDGVNSAAPSWQTLPAQGTLTYYFQNTASNVTGYKKQLPTPYTPKTTLSTTTLPVGTDVVQNWITDPGFPNLTFIPAGQYEFHIHAARPVANGKTVTLYAEIWEANSSGANIARIGTSEVTPAIGTSEVEYRLYFATSSTYIMASTSSRIVTKVYATISGPGPFSPTVDLYYGDEADSHIALPSNTVDATNFVPYSGATADVDLGTHNFTVLGTSTFATSTFSGTVGIGTTTPNAALSVIGTSTTQGLNISNLTNSFIAVDTSGNVISTTTSQFVTGTPWTGMSYLTGVVTSGGTLSGIGTVGSPLAWSNTNNYISNISGQDLSTADNSTSQFISSAMASSTYASTSFVTTNFPTFTYASSTFASTSWVLGTFASTSYLTSNYPTFAYASSTFASTSWVTSTFLPLSASTSLPYLSNTLSFLASTSPFTTGYIQYATSSGALTDSGIYYDYATRNVGIGTTSPASLLELDTENIGATAATTSGLSLINNTAAASGSQQYSPSIWFKSYGWGTTASTSQPAEWQITSVPQQATVANPQLMFNSSSNNSAYATRLTLSQGGTLTMTGALTGATTGGFSNTITDTMNGIGTTTSGNAVLITNTTAATAGNRIQSSDLLTFSGLAYAVSTANSQANQIALNIQPVSASTTYPTLVISAKEVNGNVLSSANALMVVSGNGTVGIGSSTPSASLSVVGTTTMVDGTSFTPAIANFASSSGTSALYIAPSGYVGINQTNPTEQLSVVGATSNTLTALSVQSSPSTNYTGTIMTVTPSSAMTSGTGLSISQTGATSRQTALSGKLLNVSGATNLTANSYAMAGNIASFSRSYDYNNAGQTLTVTGSVVDINDTMTQTGGTIAHSANVLSITQGFATATGAVLNVTGKGTGDLLDLVDNTTTVFAVKDGGKVGIGTTTPATVLYVVGTITTQNLNISNLSNSFLAVDMNGNVIATSTADLFTNYVNYNYASSTFASTSFVVNNFPTFAYASSTFASTSWIVGTFASTSWVTSTFETIASLGADYVSTTTLTANYPTFAYASSTFASTSFVTATYVPYSYASSTFASTSWIVGTFASTSWVTNTFATIANYPTYTYASSTFASTSFVTTNFPTFAYASSTFASTSFVTATYVPYTGATGAVNLGTQSFTANGTNIMASTTISQVTLGNNLTSSFLAVDQNGNITSTTTSEFVTGTPWTGMSYLTGVVTSGGTLSGIGTVGSPLAWSNTNNYISNISGQDLSTADNSTSQFLSSATASSTYASTTWVLGTFASTSWITSTFPSFAYASSTFASTSFVVNNFPSYAYASSTFASTSWVTNTFETITALGADYVSTTTLTSTYPSFAYASSTFASTSWVLGTFASTSYLTSNYPTFTYASSTFASTSWVLGTFASTSFVTTNFPTFAYASSTFASTSFVTATYVPYTGATGAVNLGTQSFTANGTNIMASTTISQVTLGNNLTSSFLAVDQNGNITSTTTSEFVTGTPWTGMSYLTGVVTSGGTLSGIGTVGSPLAWSNTNNYISNISGQDLSTADNSTSQFLSSATASSTYASTTWVLGTFASTSWITSTFPSFAYASSTFASTSFVVNNFPSYAYASSTFASTSFVTATYVPYTGATTNVNLGANTFTVSGTSTLATTSITQLTLGNGLASTFLAVDPNGKIISTTTPTGSSQWTTNASSIYYSGNVGIGTTSPLAKFEVYGTAGNNAIANFASSTNSSVLYIAASGFVGIGTTTPATALYVIGTSTIQNLNISNLSNAFLAVDSSGNVITTTTPSGSSASSSLSANVIYASTLSGIHSDSNLTSGGGTDDTAVLQSAIDTLASEGGGELILDKVFLVGSLHVPSDITIRGLGWNTGLYRADHTDAPIIRNENPSTTTAQDTNIQLINFQVSLNGINQDATPIESEGDCWVNGVAFYGVSDVTLDTIRVYNADQPNIELPIMFTNTSYVTVENTEVYMGLSTNNDGIHFTGPNSHLVLKNIKGAVGAQLIDLNSTDAVNGLQDCSATPWIINSGDITDVLIDGIEFMGSEYGISVLSGANNIKHLTIKNVHGTTVYWTIGFWNAWDAPTYTGGIIDDVLLENISMTYGQPIQAYHIGSGLVHIGNLQISNSRWAYNGANVPWFNIESGVTIDSLQMDNITVNNSGQPLIKNDAEIKTLSMNGIKWYRPAGSSPSGYMIGGNGTTDLVSMVDLDLLYLSGAINPTQTVGTSTSYIANDLNVLGNVISSDDISAQNLNALTINSTTSNSTEANISDTLITGTANITQAITFGTTTAGLGGTVTVDGAYTIRTFTSSGTFTTPASTTDYSVLIVAGGGGGGGGGAPGGGGGAGGAVASSSITLATSTAYTVTVGDGGEPAVNGDDSSFDDLTASGGGHGCTYEGTTGDGGSGGGGGYSCPTGGAGTAGQGYDGGDGAGAVDPYETGGGGGAGDVGGTYTSYQSGNGGVGTSSGITGYTAYYGGGGGGTASTQGTVYGTGGAGGGGDGAIDGSSNGSDGTANTGGGGGGSHGGTGGSGGSGVIIIRYLTPANQQPTIYLTNINGLFNFTAGISIAGVLGINTSSPAAFLDVYGTSTLQKANLFTISSSSLARLFTVSNAGYVGIGASNPQNALSLTGGDNISIDMSTPAKPTIASSTTGGTLSARVYYIKISASDGVGVTTPSTEVTATTTGTTGSITLSGYSVTGASSYRIYFATSTGAGNENVYISTTTTTFVLSTSTPAVYTAGTVPTVTTAYVDKISASGNSWLLGGNVGIGSSTPVSLLELGKTISGTTTLSAGALFDEQAYTFTDASTSIGKTGTGMTWNYFGQQTIAATNASTTQTNLFGVYIAGAPTTSGGGIKNVGTSTALFVNGGTVSASTTIAYSLVVIAPTGAASNYAAYFNGNVGIGTSTSNSILSVASTSASLISPAFQVQTGSTGAPTNGLVYFNFNGARTAGGAAFQITDISTTIATTTQITSNSLTTGNALTINATGLTTGSGEAIFTTGTSQTGPALLVQTGSTGAPTNGLVYFNFNSARNTGTSNTGFQITDLSTNGTTTQITSNSMSTGTAMTINATALTSGSGLSIITTNTTQTGPSLKVQTGGTSAPTNGLVYFNFNGARTAGGAAFQITDISTTIATTTQITSNSLTTGNALTINATGLTTGSGEAIFTTGTSQTGPALLVQTGSTGAPTNGLVYFNFNSARNTGTSNTGFQITDLSTNGTTTQITSNSMSTGTAMTINATALTSGSGLSIITTNTTQTGPSLKVQTGGTSAPTNGLVYFNFNGARTAGGAAFQITDISTTIATTTQITSNSLTTGNALTINATGLTTGSGEAIFTTGTSQTGPALLVQTGSTGAPTNGLVYFNFNAAHTNTGFQITDLATTGTTTQITANSSTGGTGLAIIMNSSSKAAGAALFILASSTAASSTTADAGIIIDRNSASGNGLRYIRFGSISGPEIGAIINSSNSAISYVTGSDRRLKTDITETHYGLADLMKVQVADFKWISDGSGDTGFIAQDLYNIYPNAVTAGDNGTDPYILGTTNTWSVDYGKLTPLILKGVQDLNNNFIASTTALEASSSADEANINEINNTLSRFLNASSSTLTIDSITAGVEIIAPSIKVNGLIVDSVSSLADAISFMNDTIFFGRPYFNTDTAGFAVIAKGQESVDVKFDNPYLEQPIVNATISLNKSDNPAADSAAVGDIFANDIRYVIANKSTIGFTIILNKPAIDNTTFSWTAFAIKNAKTFGYPSDYTLPAASSSPPSGGLSGSGSSGNSSSTLTTINITPVTASLTIGDATTTQQLSAETLDQNGDSIIATLTWASDNVLVATVDDSGLVTPVGAGTANITASSGLITSDSSVITVASVSAPMPTLTAINISPATANLTVGDATTTQQLSAETLDQNGDSIIATLTWASDNVLVATVDDSGLVTPVGAGTANITASSGLITSNPAAITVQDSATSTP